MDVLYLIFLNFGEFLNLTFLMLPTVLELLLSMWQTWIFIVFIFLLLEAQGITQYILVDKNEKMFEE